jgi:hypothetical protein
VVAEADELHGVLREARGDQAVQRERRSDFAVPQVPLTSIEYERSTSSATAALLRRSVSTTSTSSTRSRTGPPVVPSRSTALRTVRTTSIGWSSPNSHGRLAP